MSGVDPGRWAEAHHIFSQEHREMFFLRGIMVDDPRYLAWVDKNIHREIHMKNGVVA